LKKWKKINWEFVVTTFGILLTIVGWFVDHTNDIQWVQKIIASDYDRALRVYEKMIATKEILGKKDEGFVEIAAVVQGLLIGTGGNPISQIRIPNHAFSVLSNENGMESSPTITLEVTLQDGRSTTTSGVKDLRPLLRERFLESWLFACGAILFWLGILMSALGLFLLIKK
jgi:hypothetical protein